MLDSNTRAQFSLSSDELKQFQENGYIGPFDL